MDLYGDYFSDPWVDYIVPQDYPGEQRPRTTTQTQAPSYETPWYVDTINRAIERASQVATVDVAGYPPYPTFPAATPLPMTTQQQQPGGIHLSTNTLMLLVGGVLLFMLGKRGR